MITVVLLATWAGLIAFAVVSLINPPWLQAISHPGIVVESRDFKEHGDNLLRSGNFQRALSQYTRALKIKPDFGPAMCNMGLAYFFLNDFQQAGMWLTKSLGYPDTQKGLAYFYLAGVAIQNKNYDDAVAYGHSALREGYDPRAVWRRIGTAEVAAKRWENAKTAYETALAYDRDVSVPYRNMLYADMKREAADSAVANLTDSLLRRYDLDLLRALQQHDLDVSRTTSDLGIMHFNLGDTARAIELVQEALRIWPDNTRARENLHALTSVYSRPTR